MVDEDIIYNKNFLSYLKQSRNLNLTDVGYEESLKQHTVACRRSIPAEDIVKVDLMGYYDIFDIMANSGYGVSFDKWCNGFLDDYNSEGIYDLMVDNNLGGIEDILSCLILKMILVF